MFPAERSDKRQTGLCSIWEPLYNLVEDFLVQRSDPSFHPTPCLLRCSLPLADAVLTDRLLSQGTAFEVPLLIVWPEGILFPPGCLYMLQLSGCLGTVVHAYSLNPSGTSSLQGTQLEVLGSRCVDSS